MDKKRYGQIQEARRGDLEKSGLFGGKKAGKIRHWGARGAPILLSLVCTMLWSSLASALVFFEKHW